MPLITFTIPLPGNGEVTSGATFIQRAAAITGTVFTDVDGTIYIDQSGDGTNWDTTISAPVVGGVGAAIDVPVIAQYFQIRYLNGPAPQSAFRLFVDARDPYSAFLAHSAPPTPGGQFGILHFNKQQNTYQYVGRYDGADELGAITAAVNYTGKGGKYAAFNVVNAVVSDETPIFQTEHSIDSF